MVALLVLLSVPVPLLAQDDLPEFMEFWEFGLNIDENEGPAYFADIIAPVWQSESHAQLVFVEPRVRYGDDEYLFNTGLGYRQLVADGSWLLGANTFYDYETEHSHYRIGWGLEALSNVIEARTNMYLGLSQQRLVEENAGGSTTEEAVNGWDAEIGAPVPYYNRLKIYGGYNYYNFEEFKDRYGWTLRTEYTPFPFLVIDGLVSDSTKTDIDWGLTAAVRIPLGGNSPERIRSPFLLDEKVFPDGDAGGHMFRLVERHHEIVVERATTSPAGLTIEAARGSN